MLIHHIVSRKDTKVYRILKKDGHAFKEVAFVKGKNKAIDYLFSHYGDIIRAVNIDSEKWIYKKEIGTEKFTKEVKTLNYYLIPNNSLYAYRIEPIEIIE